ncbi:response regulator [Nodosilinea sp. E11]|uniref:response regulator n=1 Tax=Nodosilinea sp. E11 TaxID=3037479 RepID=UPI0029342475|nr:response regulator [Nodosilinea sp. E11]WOD40179.1 response regulator [Nodosilinea sp. E11]
MMTTRYGLRPILLVEDNPDDERLTLRALKRSNLTNPVVVVRNGEAALQRLFGPDCLPCVVMLDLKLPKVDGLEVLRQIRAGDRTCLLPVVVLSSSSEDRDIINSYSLGANSYVRKPVNIDEFTEAVRQLGLYWALISELPPTLP